METNIDKLALYDPIEAGLTTLEEQYGAGPQDLSVPENYEACRKALSAMRGIRGKTEKLRKELKADALAYGRMVDGAAKRIIDKVQEIETPFAEAKKDFDTRIEIEKREKALAEERRVDGIYARIYAISSLAAKHISSTIDDIDTACQNLISDLDTSSEWAMEFQGKACAAIEDAQKKLRELRDLKVKQKQVEKEAAEREEAARVQREKEAEEERIRLEQERIELAKERAAIQAEKERIELEERKRLAAIQAEKERIELEERKRLAAIQAENDRVAKEEQEKLANAMEEEKKKIQEELETLKRTQEAMLDEKTKEQHLPISQEAKNAAGRAIMAITGNKTVAKALLDAIIDGEIPHIKFTGAAE